MEQLTRTADIPPESWQPVRGRLDGLAEKFAGWFGTDPQLERNLLVQACEFAPTPSIAMLILDQAEDEHTRRHAGESREQAAEHAYQAHFTRYQERIAHAIHEGQRLVPQLTDTRSRAPRRSPRRGGAKTAQDPGDGDPDPVARRIADLVDAAPEFSEAQRQRLAQLLGGA